MKYFNILGIIGFAFSAIAATFGASMILALFGLFPWAISVIIRSIAWISLSRILQANSILYLLTGIMVIILGLSSIGSMLLVISRAPSQAESLSPFFFPTLLWMIYSLFEFFSYIKLEIKWFKIACINIVSIVIFFIITTPFPSFGFNLGNIGVAFIVLSFIIMVISAISAAIGFSKITPKTN